MRWKASGDSNFGAPCDGVSSGRDHGAKGDEEEVDEEKVVIVGSSGGREERSVRSEGEVVSMAKVRVSARSTWGSLFGRLQWPAGERYRTRNMKGKERK